MVNSWELHLNRPRHSFGHDFRTGARIVGFNLDHGRSDLRKLGDRKNLERNQSHDHDNNGNDRSKNRPFDKKMRTHEFSFVASDVSEGRSVAGLLSGDPW